MGSELQSAVRLSRIPHAMRARLETFGAGRANRFHSRVPTAHALRISGTHSHFGSRKQANPLPNPARKRAVHTRGCGVWRRWGVWIILVHGLVLHWGAQW